MSTSAVLNQAGPNHAMDDYILYELQPELCRQLEGTPTTASWSLAEGNDQRPMARNRSRGSFCQALLPNLNIFLSWAPSSTPPLHQGRPGIREPVKSVLEFVFGALHARIGCMAVAEKQSITSIPEMPPIV